MSRRRTSALGAACVAVALLGAWWAQSERGGRLPAIASRGGGGGASDDRDGELPAEVAVAEATRATRESAAAADEIDAAKEENGEEEDVAPRVPPPDAPPVFRYGRVVEAQSGRPLSQAWIARGDGAWKGEAAPDAAIVRCDGNGRFAISFVPPKRFDQDVKVAVAAGFERYGVFVAVADGYERHAFDPKQLSDDAGAPTEIALARGATLLARVVDPRGVPLFDVDVDLIATQKDRLWICAATDELGEARFTGLPPDVAFDVTLRPRRGPRLRPWNDPKPLQLAAGEERRQEWRLGGAAEVRGRALDQHGRPVAKQELVLTQRPAGRGDVTVARVYLDGNEANRQALVTTSDEEGRFAFDEVNEGSWWLGPACLSSGPFMRADRQGVAAVAQRIEVAAGAATVDVDLAFHRGLVVAGKVVDTTGRPVQARVKASSSGSAIEGLVVANSREDGSFALGPLEPGTFSFTAESFNGVANAAPIEVRVDAPRDDLRIEVPPCAYLVLRCHVDEFVQVTIVVDGKTRSAPTITSDMSYAHPVPTGRLRVEWRAGTRSGAKEVDLAPDQQLEVVVGE